MPDNSTNPLRQELHRRAPFIAKLLTVALVVMLVLFFLQWYLIKELFSVAADLIENQLTQQAPPGVPASEIQATFDRVEQTITSMPMSYITGKIRVKKVKAAADYALKANSDGVWTSTEVNTLLGMMNAAVGFKREEN